MPPASSELAAIVITIASAVVYARLLLEIAVVAPAFLPSASGPLVVMLILLSVSSIAMWIRNRKEKAEMLVPENPSELKSALMFGLVYALVIFAIAAAKERFGRGLYVVAGFSGLTDVDAITLSTSRLVSSGTLGASDGWRLIILASIANLAFKFAIIAAIGHRKLLTRLAVPYGLAIATGMSLLIWWP